MLSEVLARTGKVILRDVPPDGRSYWEARYWDRDGAERHAVLGPEFLLQKRTVEKLIERYGTGSERILEFACGTGEFTKMAAALEPQEIVALDISREGLEMTRRKVPQESLRLVRGDFWEDHGLGTADLVVCIDAIHHLGDVRQVLERLKTFVRPGGVLIGNVWTSDHFHEFGRKRYGRLQHLTRTAMFLGTAMLIRASGGRLKTGSYRTQLCTSGEVLGLVDSIFDEVLETTAERYFTAFVCRV
jgi:SAM-dependent methyltransferase